MRLLLLLPLLPLVAGCGDDLSTSKGATEAQADAHEDLAKVFDSIKDKASAEAAKPKVEALMKRIHEAQAAAMKLTGEMKIEDMQKATEKLAAAMQKSGAAQARVLERLMNDPAAQAVVESFPR